MSPDVLWSIGELAERAGTTVKTVRFYSDRGLLPAAGRSSGGHRRYGPDALERLRLIRSLRTLDLPVAEVGRALEQESALEDAVARQLREIGSQLAALRWREAALRLLQDCSPAERADRLQLIGAVAGPPDTTVMARFWRRVLPPRLPAPLLTTIIDAAVPQPPDDPTPTQVLAFARMHALTAPGRLSVDVCRPDLRAPGEDYRPAVLYQGLAHAYELAAAQMAHGHGAARAGEALDRFVAAHADARGLRDTPQFRRRLGYVLDRTADPLVDRYWQLVTELATPPDGPPAVTPGSADAWLRAALDTQLAGSTA
ncbi:MerR family transcriptional regulator [Kitasatospora sp. NPDC093806]|uniref:helix-turn-helix domain-containing protein n=1 Tax=Kitasatospora sp. NPDC093806 TaxID=3155075 RepID=UPI003430B786